MKTCCQTCEVHVTPGDVGRISAYTARRDFHEYRAPLNEVYEVDDDPAWQENVFRPDGTRRILKRLASGNCPFLGPHGCTLPLEVRPLLCRIYPYEFDEQGIKQGVLAPGCPLELLPPGQGLLQALDMNLHDAQRWHAQLYQEIRLNHGSSVDDEDVGSAPRGVLPGGVSCESA